MVLIDGWVPQGVQVVSCVVVGEGEGVTTSVALGELFVDSAGGVEGLMDISDIVDQKTHSVRSAHSFLVLGVGHNSLVCIWVLVVSGVAEPVDEFGDDEGDILVGELVAGEVGDLGPVINERIVDKVPFLLPLAAFHSDIISKGSTLDERMVSFLDGQGWAVVLEGFEFLVDISEGCWVFSLQLVKSNTSD